MKKAVFAFLTVFSMLFSVSAFAADPDLVSTSNGSMVFNLGTAIGVAPASANGTAHTQVLYENSTGWQSISDNGTKYSVIRDRLVSAYGAIEVGTGTGVYYVVRKARIGCQYNNTSQLSSFVQADNTGNVRYDYMSGDNCAYRNKVGAQAN